MDTNQEIDKEKTIKKEIARLKRILKDVDANKKNSIEGLIHEAAFMRATLQELKTMVDIDGPLDEMQQGEYSIMREHPALKAYNTMIQRYTVACKEILSILPKDVVREIDDGFENFVVMKNDS